MRRRKAELRARVNGPLTLRYERTGLTSYAGLDFVRRWLQRDGVLALVRRELATTLPPTDYGVCSLVLVVVALLLSGGSGDGSYATSFLLSMAVRSSARMRAARSR